jgi:hypothetical protein
MLRYIIGVTRINSFSCSRTILYIRITFALLIMMMTGPIISSRHNITVQYVTGQWAGLSQIFYRSGSHRASS